MKLELKPIFVLQLDARELRLVASALRGNLREDQVADALELQNKIMAAKVNEIKQTHEVEKLERNLTEVFKS